MPPSRSAHTAAELSSGQRLRLQATDSLSTAAQQLVASGFPVLPVCDTHGRLVGSITAAAALAALARGAPLEQPVSALMNTDPPVIADYAGPEWVLTEMIEARTWVLPVIDADDRLVALISLHDLATAIGPALLADSWQRITAGHA